MEPHNLLEVEISHLGDIIGRLVSKEICHFGEAINYNHDGIVLPLSPREADDEFQTHILPRSLGSRKR